MPEGLALEPGLHFLRYRDSHACLLVSFASRVVARAAAGRLQGPRVRGRSRRPDLLPVARRSRRGGGQDRAARIGRRHARLGHRGGGPLNRVRVGQPGQEERRARPQARGGAGRPRSPDRAVRRVPRQLRSRVGRQHGPGRGVRSPAATGRRLHGDHRLRVGRPVRGEERLRPRRSGRGRADRHDRNCRGAGAHLDPRGRYRRRLLRGDRHAGRASASRGHRRGRARLGVALRRHARLDGLLPALLVASTRGARAPRPAAPALLPLRALPGPRRSLLQPRRALPRALAGVLPRRRRAPGAARGRPLRHDGGQGRQPGRARAAPRGRVRRRAGRRNG